MQGLAIKRDFLFASIIGFLFGAFAIPILENVRPPQWSLTFLSGAVLIIGFVLFANLAIWIAGLIGARLPIIWQFAKYAAVGAMNSIVDIGILNILSAIFQVFSGPLILALNSFSFMVAVTNSYFWNRFWTFQKTGATAKATEYGQFLAVTVVGLFLNTGVVYLLTTIVGAPDGFSEPQWENVAKFAAIAPNLIWNYIGYKFIVFKA